MKIEKEKNVLLAAFFEGKESGSHVVVASPKVPKGMPSAKPLRNLGILRKESFGHAFGRNV